jgi:hypothetical protein
MTQPKRLRDDASAPGQLRELVGRGRWSRPFSDEQRARSAARLDRLVALPVAAGVLFWIKGVAIAAGLGVGVAAAVYVLPSLQGVWRQDATLPVTVVPSALGPARPRSPSGNVVPVAAPAASPSPLPAPAASSALPERVESAIPPGPAAAAPPRGVPLPMAASAGRIGSEIAPEIASGAPVASAAAGDVHSLAREAAMLEGARAVLEQAPGDALSKVEEHALAFPEGHLALEREMLAVDALRRLGRTDDARARGQALLVRYHGSLYEARVRAMLDALPPRP